MTLDNIDLEIPGNKLHHLSEILARICYTASDYYDEEKAEEEVASVEQLFYTIEHFMKENPEYRTPSDSLDYVTIYKVSGAMINSIFEIGERLLEHGDIIDGLHDVPIDISSILSLLKKGIRNHKIQQIVLE